MKKKAVHKKSIKSTPSYYRYLVIAFIILILVLTAKVAYQGLKSNGVLGISSFDSQDAGNQDSNSQDQQNQTPEPQSNNDKAKTPEPKEVKQTLETPEPVKVNSETKIQDKVELQTQNNKLEINAATEGTKVEIKSEDNGALSFKAKKADGTEVQLQDNSLARINEAMSQNDVNIGTTSAKGFEITNKETKAETQFPISVDLTNKMLSVSTPNGQKDLTVLPNQAVQNLFNQKVIDRVAQTANSTNGAQLQLVQLKLFANNPVFQVQGIDDKKLFGLVPVAVQKTTLVSAQTGQVVNTNMDLVNTILNFFSFQ